MYISVHTKQYTVIIVHIRSDASMRAHCKGSGSGGGRNTHRAKVSMDPDASIRNIAWIDPGGSARGYWKWLIHPGPGQRITDLDRDKIVVDPVVVLPAGRNVVLR